MPLAKYRDFEHYFFAKNHLFYLYRTTVFKCLQLHYLVVQISEKSSFCCSIVFLCCSSMHPLTPVNSSHSCYNGVCLGYVFVYTIFSKSKKKKKNARLRLSIFHEILIAFNRMRCISSFSKKLPQLVTQGIENNLRRVFRSDRESLKTLTSPQ